MADHLESSRLEARATAAAEGRDYREGHLQCIVVTPESTVLDDELGDRGGRFAHLSRHGNA